MDNLSTSNSASSNAYVKADQFYSDQQPVAFFSNAGNTIHFEHQDWVGTERMRTGNNGNEQAFFSSLPFGEPNLTRGSDLDPAHFTGLDLDGSFSASSLRRNALSLHLHRLPELHPVPSQLLGQVQRHVRVVKH